MIDDCFLRFWFRFIFKNRYLQGLGRYDRMREMAERDFDAFAGYSLERYFHWKMIEDSTFTRMGAWWEACARCTSEEEFTYDYNNYCIGK